MPEYFVRALEGVDGSGKTTVGKMVAETVGARYFYCMDGNPLKRYRKVFDSKPTLIRFLYYMAISLANFRTVERFRESSDVFYDRTICSTLAYHRAYGLPERWIKLVPVILLNQIDMMIYFSVSNYERARRLSLRQRTLGTMTKSDERSLSLGPAIDREYRRLFQGRSLIVETDFKTPSEVAQEVIRRLYEK